MDHTIDAKNKRFGRLASQIAHILQGKHSASYARNKVSTDRVVVKNVSAITIGGAKLKEKMYYRHTGYMGHLREKTFEQAFEKDPKKVLREAVRRMMPKNFLNAKRLKNLVFADSENK